MQSTVYLGMASESEILVYWFFSVRTIPRIASASCDIAQMVYPSRLADSPFIDSRSPRQRDGLRGATKRKGLCGRPCGPIIANHSIPVIFLCHTRHWKHRSVVTIISSSYSLAFKAASSRQSIHSHRSTKVPYQFGYSFIYRF